MDFLHATVFTRLTPNIKPIATYVVKKVILNISYMKKTKIYIGTSGWTYKHWHNSFYPHDQPKNDLLSHFTKHFTTVEINTTFYHLPLVTTVKNWHDKVPPGFIFAVKGSRFITHLKRLKDTEEPIKNFLHRIAPLKEHLGPILWQLPPSLKKDSELLKKFIGQLPRRFQHAIEFRHPSWIEPGVFDILHEHNIAQVWLSSLRMPINFESTADFVYLRLHGLEGGFSHDYTVDELQPWANQLLIQVNSDKPGYVYFNNDENTRAPQNAKMLEKMIGEFSATPTCSSFNRQQEDLLES